MNTSKTFVIAEAGLSFLGEYKKAVELVDIAKGAGADAVKFQTFLPSFDPALARFTLTAEKWQKLASYCTEQKIIFMSTPFDRWAFGVLRDCGMKRWKVPSGEIGNDAYLKAIPDQAEFIYVSTGMATEPIIQRALDQLPSPADKNICLMYCVSGYPVPSNELNLHTILRWNISDFPQYDTGFSDHTVEFGWAKIAVALGATVVEKHFCLESNGGPDKNVSACGEVHLRRYIEGIRKVERALGDGEKKPQACETESFEKARNRFK